MLRKTLVPLLAGALVLLASAEAQAWGGMYSGVTQITPDGYLHYGAPYSGPAMIGGFMHYGNPNVAVPQYSENLPPLGPNYGGQWNLQGGYAGGGAGVYGYGYASPFGGPGYGGYQYTTPGYYGGYYGGGVRAGGVYGGYRTGAVWAPH
jgi:hypothetical protein